MKVQNLQAFSGITGSLSGSALIALTASYMSGNINFPNGLDVTGSIVVTNGGFTGSLQGTATSASYAVTASYAMNGGGGGVSASYATTASYAETFSGFIDFPEGLAVTGSLTVTGGITGSISGNIASADSAISSSYAATASVVTGTVSSASFATTASFANVSNFNNLINIPSGLISSSAQVVASLPLGTVSSSVQASNWSVASASVALSASFAESSSWNNLIGKPIGLVSSSAQASTWTVASASVATSASYATVAQTVLGTISSASYAATASFINFPNGLTVTGSLLATGGLSGSWQYSTVYNVREFGATGQIGQDARPFIQAAINSASLNNGGIVFLPKGTYSISSSLFMSNSIALVGEGVDATILRSATVGTGLSFSGSAMISGSDVLWSYIGNMTMQGVGINGTTCTGIYYNNNNRETHDHNVIERVFMDGMSTYGIHWDNALGGRISQVRINNTGGDAVRIIGGTALSLHEVYANGSVYNGFFLSGITYSGFYNTAADSCRTAYRLIGVRNNFFNGCGGEAVASAVGDPDRPGRYFWISNSEGITLASCYASGFVDTNSSDRSYLVVDTNSRNIIVSAFRGVTGSYGNNPSYRYSVTGNSSAAIMYSDFAGPVNTLLEASASVVSLNVNGVTTYSNLVNATSSFAITASYALNGGSGGPSVSSSWASQSLSSSVATFAQTAATASYISGAIDFPNGFTVTGSLIVAGGITGSVSGNIANADTAISSSYALTASYALNGGGGGPSISSSWASQSLSSSFATTASYANVSNFDTLINRPSGLVSSSVQIVASLPAGTVSSSAQIVSGLPAGTVSSSAQASTWTVASSSVATTSSYSLVAQTVLGSITSASYAATASVVLGSIQSASYAQNATTASYAETFDGFIEFPDGLAVTGSLVVTGGVTASLQGTSSYAVTASYINGTVDFPNGLAVTGSVIATTGFTGSLSGSATSASFAQTAIWNTLSGIPSGIVSSSAQASTWTVASASVALSASIAASSSWNNLIGRPSGIVSSSAQVVANISGQSIAPSTIVATSITGSLKQLFVGTTAPANPAVNDLWVDTN